MRVLIQGAAGVRRPLDEDDLRQQAIGVGTGENVVVLGDVPHLSLLGGPIRELSQEDAGVLIVVAPIHSRLSQRAEDRLLCVGRVVRVRIRADEPERSSREQVHAAGDGWSEQWREESVTDGILRRQFVVVRKIGLIVIPHRPLTGRIVLVRHRRGRLQETFHRRLRVLI